MGKVFSWEEVKKRQVPNLIDFKRFNDMLQSAILMEGSIQRATVCGSVNRGDHTVRSDIDCFVLYDASHEDQAFDFMQRMVVAAQTMFIPLSFIPCDSEVAGTRMHHIGPSFARHIAVSSKDGYVKGDCSALCSTSITQEEELESYMRVKMYSLQESWAEYPASSEDSRMRHLKKLTEAPMHIARKVLARIGELDGDSKAFVLSRYQRIINKKIFGQLRALVEADAQYTKMLEQNLTSPDEVSYKRALDDLALLYPKVISFIRSNLILVNGLTR